MKGPEIFLVELGEHLTPWLHLCSKEEVENINHFSAQNQKKRVLWSRAAARLCVSKSMSIAADDIEISRDVIGRPVVKTPGRSSVALSLSRGREMCVIAINQAGKIGVDIEPSVSGLAWKDILPRLHADEQDYLLEKSDPSAAFLELWVTKEAVAKYRGHGFTRPANTWSCLAPEFAQKMTVWTKVQDHAIAVCSDNESRPTIVQKSIFPEE